jgi:hypothetical protein
MADEQQTTASVPMADPGWPAPTCWTCRFWTRNNGRTTTDTDAECRRHAPRPTLYRDEGGETPAINAAWPATDSDDWCGDHLPLPDGTSNG